MERHRSPFISGSSVKLASAAVYRCAEQCTNTTASGDTHLSNLNCTKNVDFDMQQRMSKLSTESTITIVTGTVLTVLVLIGLIMLLALIVIKWKGMESGLPIICLLILSRLSHFLSLYPSPTHMSLPHPLPSLIVCLSPLQKLINACTGSFIMQVCWKARKLNAHKMG